MPHPFESVDIVKGIIYCGFWFWQWTMSSGSMKSRGWYERYRQRIPLSPPGWLFGVVWAVLFTLLGVSTYWYARNYGGAAVLWLVLANALANKVWSVLFFDRSQVLGALLTLMLAVLPTGVLIPILMATQGAWGPFALWAPYPVWLLVALYLNWNWLRRGFPTNDDKEEPPVAEAIRQKAAEAIALQDVMVLSYDEDGSV